MIDLSTFKFRAWNRRENKMIYFQGNDDADNLSHLESRNDIHIKNNFVTIEVLAGTSNRSFLIAGDPDVPLEDFDLMMYSIREDCNGERLCMGDIIKLESEDILGGYGFFLSVL